MPTIIEPLKFLEVLLETDFSHNLTSEELHELWVLPEGEGPDKHSSKVWRRLLLLRDETEKGASR